MHVRIPAVALTAATLLAGCAQPAARPPRVPDGTRADVAILETTDLHANVRSYDYYRLQDDPTLGFERVATLIRQARAQFPNTLLFDDGDTIQGTALADYQALAQPVGCDQELAIYRAMDALGYDGGTIGNHEFNYGLPFLAQVTGTPMDVPGVAPRRCAGPRFPLVLSNVFGAKDGRPLYAPWRVIAKTFTAYAPDGSAIAVPLKVGIVGFAPPPIMDWDRRNLAGKVTVKGVVEAAARYVPELRAQGVDLVVAISHGGLNPAPYVADMENANWHLAGVPGIDAILLGHSHDVFPNPDPHSRFAHMPGVDDARGFVRGVPAVMGGFFGRDLGVIRLALLRRGGRWVVDEAATHSEVRPVCPQKNACVAPDPEIAPLVAAAHAATVAYVQTPIGRSDFRMSTYFADVGDVSALAAVAASARAYVEDWIARDHADLKGIPVLAAASAFKAGFGGPGDYTDVAAGDLSIRSAADLYLYPNTLAAVKLDGAGVKAWLEKSAERFNRIDPARPEAQALIDPRVPSYNFDVLFGELDYAIDVTRPAGQRIVDLRWRGKPLDPAQPFLVVTNNYRASGGGRFPGLDGANLVLSAPDTNRDVLIGWIRAHGTLHRADVPARPWRFARVHTAGPVTFVSAAGKADAARAAGLDGVRLLHDNGDGSATYAIDLSR
ncbi:MAG: bifunctional 2',3'-cyclic-nucleotide 2'-phosphodiesterase/3'-nucleotidase [Xanthomonadaceae bacterium]|nr:bifunctional 2',3'-cyclic-nucleotide 2'-phosphodiesterase/3'-nucleotidase [Xanthomonadaceae bacterium]